MIQYNKNYGLLLTVIEFSFILSMSAAVRNILLKYLLFLLHWFVGKYTNRGCGGAINSVREGQEKMFVVWLSYLQCYFWFTNVCVRLHKYIMHIYICFFPGNDIQTYRFCSCCKCVASFLPFHWRIKTYQSNPFHTLHSFKLDLLY